MPQSQYGLIVLPAALGGRQHDLDGKEIRSCVTPVAAVVERSIATLEGGHEVEPLTG
jgi:hypothetical protein